MLFTQRKFGHFVKQGVNDYMAKANSVPFELGYIAIKCFSFYK